MPSHNFKQWNPNAANQETDTQYNADALRSGGATLNAVFGSKLANKLFYQITTAWAALCQALVNKGYSPNDGSTNPATAIANLSAIFANFMTQADMAPFALNSSFASFAGTTGYQKFPGGLILQWATGTTMFPIDDETQILTFKIPFPANNFISLASLFANGGSQSDYFVQVVNKSLANAQIILQSASPASGIGPGSGTVTPLIIAIGN